MFVSARYRASGSSALVAAFERRAAAAAVRIYRERIERERPWTEMMISLHEASNAHGRMLLVRNFYEALQATGEDGVPDGAKAALGALFRLFALDLIKTDAAAFLVTLAFVWVLIASSSISTQSTIGSPPNWVRLSHTRPRDLLRSGSATFFAARAVNCCTVHGRSPSC